uniref:Uncharacterized protein n=1 Tax=Anguilla anguilla TaxID=7936 RepID=A0A0E9PNA8_ANGAN
MAMTMTFINIRRLIRVIRDFFFLCVCLNKPLETHCTHPLLAAILCLTPWPLLLY